MHAARKGIDLVVGGKLLSKEGSVSSEILKGESVRACVRACMHACACPSLHVYHARCMNVCMLGIALFSQERCAVLRRLHGAPRVPAVRAQAPEFFGARQ